MLSESQTVKMWTSQIPAVTLCACAFRVNAGGDYASLDSLRLSTDSLPRFAYELTKVCVQGLRIPMPPKSKNTECVKVVVRCRPLLPDEVAANYSR